MPIHLVIVGLAACGVGGVLAHRQTGGLKAKARAGLCLAVAVATVLTLVHSTARSPLNADGNPNLAGFAGAVMLLAFIAGLYWDSLEAWRWLMPAAIVALTALALSLFPMPSAVDARHVLAALVGAMYPFLPCRHLTSALRRVTAQHAQSTRAQDEEAVRTAFVEGRESVVGLVRQAREDALAQLARLGPQLDARLGELAALRLEEVNRRLSGLDP